MVSAFRPSHESRIHAFSSSCENINTRIRYLRVYVSPSQNLFLFARPVRRFWILSQRETTLSWNMPLKFLKENGASDVVVYKKHDGLKLWWLNEDTRGFLKYVWNVKTEKMRKRKWEVTGSTDGKMLHERIITPECLKFRHFVTRQILHRVCEVNVNTCCPSVTAIQGVTLITVHAILCFFW
jgi:hypothetical protein